MLLAGDLLALVIAFVFAVGGFLLTFVAGGWWILAGVPMIGSGLLVTVSVLRCWQREGRL